MTAKQNVLSKALKLSEKDRLEVAEVLFESVDGVPDKEVDEAWAKELLRRIEEVDSGQVRLVDWKDVRRRLMRNQRADVKAFGAI